MDLSQACNAAGVTSNPKLGEAEGLIGVLSNGRVTRQAYTEQALQMCFFFLEQRSLYARAGAGGNGAAVAVNGTPTASAVNAAAAAAAAATMKGVVIQNGFQDGMVWLHAPHQWSPPTPSPSPSPSSSSAPAAAGAAGANTGGKGEWLNIEA